MSCNSTSNRVADAVRRSGIPALGSKSAYNAAFVRRELSPWGRGALGLAAAGAAMGAVYAVKRGKLAQAKAKLSQTQARGPAKAGQAANRAGDMQYRAAAKVAGVSNRLTGALSVTGRLGAGRLAMGVALWRKPALGRALRKLTRLSGVAKKATGLAGTQAAALSRQSLAGSVVQERRTLLFFKKKVAVEVWNSGLSRLLNRADQLGPTQNVRASRGTLLKDKQGATWHCGTTTAATRVG